MIRAPQTSVLSSARAGVSLVELLSVVAIIAVLSGLAVPLGSALLSRHEIRHNAGLLSGLLEQARMHAMAKRTYTYAAFRPHGSSLSMVVLASTDGVGNLSDPAAFNRDLRPATKPLTFESLALASIRIPGTDPALDFLEAAAPVPAPEFQFPEESSPTSLTRVIRFNPRGEAEIPSGGAWSLLPLTDLGLQAMHGDRPSATHVASLRLSGLSGAIQLLMP